MVDANDLIDRGYMAEALKEAQKAALVDEVPVGAVIVHERKIIARAHNQVELLKDPTAHAEMIAITQAANYLSCKWLTDCTIYVTIEPCSMCVGALVLARITDLCFGARDDKTGACGSVLNVSQNGLLNHDIAIREGVCADECASVLQNYFQLKRKKNGVSDAVA